MSTTQIITYAIIALVLLIILLVMLKLNKKDFNMEVNKLVKDGYQEVTLLGQDVSIVDKEGITKLGAKGIVEIDNQLKIIFGSDNRTLMKYINEMK